VAGISAPELVGAVHQANNLPEGDLQWAIYDMVRAGLLECVKPPPECAPWLRLGKSVIPRPPGWKPGDPPPALPPVEPKPYIVFVPMSLAILKPTRALADWRRTHDIPPADNGQTEGSRWLSVTEAASASGCHRGDITRAVDKGELGSNGKRKRERRIDAASLALWQLKRANRPEPVESDGAVKKKLERGRNMHDS
jgi:hypothetical protein